MAHPNRGNGTTWWTAGLLGAVVALLLVGAWIGGLPDDQRAVLPVAGAGAITSLSAIAIGVAALWVYLLPAWIARRNGHRNATALTVANVLLGWTFVGWVACLVWSLLAQERSTVGS